MKNKKMYEYTQDYLIKKQFTNDILNREGFIYKVSGGDTSFPVGTNVLIVGKENSGLYKCKVVGTKSKIGYVTTADFILAPRDTVEFEIAKGDFEEKVNDIALKITFLTETESDEFDEIDYRAWTILKSLKGAEDAEVLKTITKALLEIAPPKN